MRLKQRKENTNIMKRTDLRKQAFQDIKAGKSKQQTYNELKEMPGVSPNVAATVVRNIPSLQSRQEYRALVQIFIFYLGLMIFNVIFRTVMMSMANGFDWVYLIALIPIGIYTFLIWGVATFNGYSYKYVAIWLTIQFFFQLINSMVESFTLFDMLVLVFVGAGIGLGFYLYYRLCPNYQIFHEEFQIFPGEKEMRKIIKFRD